MLEHSSIHSISENNTTALLKNIIHQPESSSGNRSLQEIPLSVSSPIHTAQKSLEVRMRPLLRKPLSSFLAFLYLAGRVPKRDIWDVSPATAGRYFLRPCPSSQKSAR